MEAERRALRKRKPLADRTNLSPNTRSSSSSLHKLPPPPPPPTTTKSTSAAAVAASKPTELESNNQREQHQLIDSSSTEARNKRRKKLADTTTSRISVDDDDDGNKENVDADANNNSSTGIVPDVSSSPSTPVRQPLSPLVEPLTVYARRQAVKKKGKEKVINEAFTCPPVERERNESNKPSFAKISKCRTELPKKRRIKEHVVSKDYFEQQRAYFAEIDKCELPEEEVSESELSDH